MASVHVPCGSPVNLSEERAIKQVCSLLNGTNDGSWIVFSNFLLLSLPDRQPDDLDIVCVGPRGVILIEVKHWDGGAFGDPDGRAPDEARKLKSKAERLAGVIRKNVRGIRVFVDQWFLLTRETAGNSKPPAEFGGAKVFTLHALKNGIAQFQGSRLTALEVDAIRHALEPRSRIQTDGKIRRLAEFENLELWSASEQRFHRIYRGVHRRTREKVLVHLYDLSASDDKDPEGIARREFRALQVLQRSHFVPRFRDSFQQLADYPGEIWFFTVFDPDAPSIAKRSLDETWSIEQRIQFAIECLRALREVHGLTDDQKIAVVHRNLSPEALLVGGRNRPIITNFSLAKLPLTQTIANTSTKSSADWIAPEIRDNGLIGGTTASDVFSMCHLLRILFSAPGQPNADAALKILAKGCAEAPIERATLDSLLSDMESAAGLNSKVETPHQPIAMIEEIPAAEYWCEGTEFRMSGRMLRVLARLGSGGVGSAFKVEEYDPETGEPYGTFVAKVIRASDTGQQARRAYLRVRSYTNHRGLASVHEIAEKWEADRVIALLQWLDGEPLHGIAGCAGLAAEECGESSLEFLVRRWIKEACEALGVLHANGLVHGDVSPKNLIYHPSGLRLTDFDLVTRSGQICWGCGAKGYSSPEADRREAVKPSDDVFALAASLFETIFDRSPFLHANGAVDKSRGLNWPDSPEKTALLALAPFFERATAVRPEDRFQSASDVLVFLETPVSSKSPFPIGPRTSVPPVSGREIKTERSVDWLTALLTVYPGSPHGNIETRGLDSDFAVATYVPTKLESELISEIRDRKSRLIVLCGNAGDGKTALLQRIASEFGVEQSHSAQRLWEAKTTNGIILKANLDGSAAWQGRSADQLLDELLLPFLQGIPSDDRVHLLAINDGRLLKWVDEKQAAGVTGPLVQALMAFLDHDDDASSIPAHFRFVSLNHRSLVGGRDGEKKELSATFLNDLIAALLGGNESAAKWSPCTSCSAWDRCVAGPTARRLLAPAESDEGQRGLRMRGRIAEAMQAVHQRGNVHVTARELRGALSYILFGVHSCAELHANPGIDFKDPSCLHRTGDLAFDPRSPYRQGELLRELARLDPALEAHPHLDRWLVGGSSREIDGGGRPYRGLSLASARRRAYFEWLPNEIVAVASTEDALALASGQHLGLFRTASLRTPEENAELCEKLCRGMSQLEDLPAVALQRKGKVPLRIPPRTPTESKFWTEQPLSSFQLVPELPVARDPALTVLPRRLRLTYKRSDGLMEVLPMGYELFHVLLRLADGEQLSEQRSDDLFANVQIFTQRIAQEESRSLLAWNPKEDSTVFHLGLQRQNARQSLVLKPANEIQA